MIPGLPPGQRSKVYRAVVATLQADPTLRRVVRTWSTWEGSPADAGPVADGGLPWVRITPAPAPARWATVATTESPIALLVEVTVPGTSAADLMDLWEAFERALYPGDQSVVRRLRAASPGAHCGLNLEQPGIGTVQLGDDLALVGQGHVVIPFRANTLQ